MGGPADGPLSDGQAVAEAPEPEAPVGARHQHVQVVRQAQVVAQRVQRRGDACARLDLKRRTREGGDRRREGRGGGRCG